MSSNPFGPYRTPNLGLYLPSVRTNVLDQTIAGGKMAIVYNYETIDTAISALQAGGATVAATKILYVDGGRTDSYTPNGTLSLPFKTIMAAINQIIANGDNSQSVPYKVYVLGPGTYAETLDFGNSKIVNLIVWGTGGVTIRPASGNALQSLANNDGFFGGQFQGITFAGPVNISDPTDNGSFAGGTLAFTDCFFQGPCTFSNVQSLGFWNTDFGTGQITLVNVQGAFSYMNGTGHGAGRLLMQSIAAQAKPSGFSGTYFLMQGSPMNFGTVMLLGDMAGTQLDVDIGTLLGRIGGSVQLQLGSVLRLFPGACISSDVSVDASSTFTVLGGALRGSLTIAAGGTFSLQAEVLANKMLAETFEVGVSPDSLALELGAAKTAFPTNPIIVSGAGDPNGVVDAPAGSLYLRTDGSANTCLYVKEIMSGNTGWQAK